MHRLIQPASIVTVVALVAGCASYGASSAAFSYRFPDNQLEATQAVVDALPSAIEAERPENAVGAPIAVGTTHEAPRAVVAWNLAEGRALWSTPLDAMTRPQVLGDVVLLSERGAVIALDVRDGRERWRTPLESGLAYVGGARDGDTIVYVASVGASGGARRIGHIVAADASSGRTRWEHRIQGVLGQPAARGGRVFVPWERQNVAILDLNDGVEVARLRSTDDVVAWVFDRPEGVYYGWRGIYRFDGRSHQGTREAATYREHPIPDAPRDPLVFDDAFSPKPGTRSARGRIRIYMSPALDDGGEIAVEDDSFYYVYYRYVFAFSGERELRWARALDQDVISGQALPGGLLVAGEQGQLRFLSADTGGDRWLQDMSTELASLTFDADGFLPSGEIGEASAVRAALNRIASDPDNRLVPARAFAIELLAALEEPAVTRDLLDLYVQRSMPGVLREKIREVTRARPYGSEYLVAALDQEYDFIEETRSPPLELIVPSLVESNQRGALPGLIRHMLDHETRMEVLPTVVRGVVELGDSSIAPALRSFLVLYRADSTFREQVEALAIASEGLFRHGGPEGRVLLEEIQQGTTASESLASSIGALFQAERQAREAQARADAEEAARAAEEAARRQYQELPLRLSQQALNRSFAAHSDDIRACYNDELARNEGIAQIRIVFIVDNDGSARDYRFAPNNDEFVACMSAIVQDVSFPRFRQSRQSASITIAFGSFASSNSATAQPDSVIDGPWWARNQARASSTVVPTATPWWEPRQPRETGTAVSSSTDTERPPGQGPQPWWAQTQQPNPQPTTNQTSSEAATPDSTDERPWWLPVEE